MRNGTLLLAIMFSFGAPIFTASAHAASVQGSSISLTDAKTGQANLVKGRLLEIQCWYKFQSEVGNVTPPTWRIQFQVDGKTIATPNAGAPQFTIQSGAYGAGFAFEPQFTSAFWTASTAGQHQARCLLDPDGALKAANIYIKAPDVQRSFMVDVMSVVSIDQRKSTGPKTINPSGAAELPFSNESARKHTGPITTTPKPVITLPHLTLALKAQPIQNCSAGQEVVLVSGTVSNVGTGYAQIPPGKPTATIESTVGVYSGSITTGNLIPGQAQPVSVKLKSKGFPASLAGATLKLSARITPGIKQSSYGGNEQDLTVVFPGSFCQPHAGTATPKAH